MGFFSSSKMTDKNIPNKNIKNPDKGDKERIAKKMARAGLCSRRDAEKMILEKRVKVNGKIIESPALDVSPNDIIHVDNIVIGPKEPTKLWIYHKPTGLVTSHSDPDGRETVFQKIDPTIGRVISVGRLDLNSEGLLLLTNDGELARKLELPSTGLSRVYKARAFGTITQEELSKLQNGIVVDGIKYGSIDAILERDETKNVWIRIILKEGKNREIRKVLAALGLKVNRLIRLSYGPFNLGDLPRGELKEVSKKQIDSLFKLESKPRIDDALPPKSFKKPQRNFQKPKINNKK